MKKSVRDFYFRKVIQALRKSDIRYELHPRVRGKSKAKKPPIVLGYCQKKGERYEIIIRYRPSQVNETYVLLHEALHAAFWEWPEKGCWGEPVDLMARSLWFNFSSNQIREIESYLPGR